VTGTRPLKTGDLVTVPGRTVVVAFVSLDGLQFTDTFGGRHDAGDAELVPLAVRAEFARTP
jgi:hypothetical protein